MKFDCIHSFDSGFHLVFTGGDFLRKEEFLDIGINYKDAEKLFLKMILTKIHKKNILYYNLPPGSLSKGEGTWHCKYCDASFKGYPDFYSDIKIKHTKNCKVSILLKLFKELELFPKKIQ